MQMIKKLQKEYLKGNGHSGKWCIYFIPTISWSEAQGNTFMGQSKISCYLRQKTIWCPFIPNRDWIGILTFNAGITPEGNSDLGAWRAFHLVLWYGFLFCSICCLRQATHSDQVIRQWGKQPRLYTHAWTFMSLLMWCIVTPPMHLFGLAES